MFSSIENWSLRICHWLLSQLAVGKILPVLGMRTRLVSGGSQGGGGMSEPTGAEGLPRRGLVVQAWPFQFRCARFRRDVSLLMGDRSTGKRARCYKSFMDSDL